MRDYPSLLSLLPFSTELLRFCSSDVCFAWDRAGAVSRMSVGLFVFMPQNVGKMSLFTVNRKRAREGNRGRERSGGARDGISLIQYLLIKQNYFL